MNHLTYDVFISYKRKTGEDFASHLKSGLEGEGIHAFLDIEDIPKRFKGREEWWKFRDRALVNSEVFLLIITDGMETSRDVSKEISLANENELDCVYFRHKGLNPHIVVNLYDGRFDLGEREQVEFENKEDLLRKSLRCLGMQKPTHGISKNKEAVYCRRCGALAGQQSVCTGIYTTHDFVAGSGMIYCTRCGAPAGKQSICTGTYVHHDFVSGSGNRLL